MKTKFRFTAVIMVLMAFVLTSFSSCEKDDVKPENGIEFPQELLGKWQIDSLVFPNTPEDWVITCSTGGALGVEFEVLLRNLDIKDDEVVLYRCNNQYLAGFEFTYNENDETLKYGPFKVKILQLSNQNLVIEYLKVNFNSPNQDIVFAGTVAYYHKQ